MRMTPVMNSSRAMAMVRYFDSFLMYIPYPISTPVAAWKRRIPSDPMIAAINVKSIVSSPIMEAGTNTDPNPSPSEKP